MVDTPLWDLTNKKSSFNRGYKEKEAFEQIKNLLTHASVMAYVKQNAETRMTTDALSVGLGTILEQQF